MDEVTARATLVTAPAAEGTLAATIDRSQIESALRDESGEPELVLDVMRTRPGAAEGDAKRVAIAWERDDLRRVLETTAGQRMTFSIDPYALAAAFDDEVEAHGFREKAAAMTIAVATAGVAVGAAQGSVMIETGGAGPVTASLPGSYTAMENTRSELTSGVQAESASLGAAYTAAEESRASLLGQQADDGTLGAAYTAAESSRADLIGTADDVVAVSSGGSDVVSAEDAGAIGAGAGVVALAIAAAAFASRHRRREGLA